MRWSSADQLIPAHSPNASAPKSRPAKATTRRTAKILRSDIASLEVRCQAEKVSTELSAGICETDQRNERTRPTPCRTAAARNKIDPLQLRWCRNVPPKSNARFLERQVSPPHNRPRVALKSARHKTRGKRPRGRMDRRGEKARLREGTKRPHETRPACWCSLQGARFLSTAPIWRVKRPARVRAPGPASAGGNSRVPIWFIGLRLEPRTSTMAMVAYKVAPHDGKWQVTRDGEPGMS